MSFCDYLNESTEANHELSLDEFIEKLKKEGLYGHDVLKNISEEDLRKILADDEYFKKMKSEEGDKKDLSEMVIRPNKAPIQSDIKDGPKQTNLSLAVRLGLKRQEDSTKEVDAPLDNKNEVPKETPKSFSDRLKDEYEQRKKERLEKEETEKAIRDERLKRAEEESKEDKPEPTFSNAGMKSQNDKDDKTEDKTNDDFDKKLTAAMFRRSRANTKVDDNGYKKVTNLGSINDKAAADKLNKEMDSKFPKEDPEVDSKKTIGNSNVPVKKMTNTEYSKRTLLAIADRMDFDVYAKFRKANGTIRTGNFKIGKTTSQITQKTDTIIVQDLDLSKEEKKVVWRTIPLERIINIKPI